MIKLRKIEPSDLPFLYQWENDVTMWADSDTHNPLSRHDLQPIILGDKATGLLGDEVSVTPSMIRRS